MASDISRDTAPYALRHDFTEVLRQQGRLELDADGNEQVRLQRHRDETEASDEIGRFGAPKHAAGFGVQTDGRTLRLSAGRFYLDGMLVENRVDDLELSEQPYGVGLPPAAIEDGQEGLVYLEAFRRERTALDEERLREKALGGPDTATRIQVVWRVRILGLPAGTLTDEVVKAIRKGEGFDHAGWRAGDGRLEARTIEPTTADADCALPPQAGYRSQENQLYRVEIHRSGARTAATFKWAIDNASAVGWLVRRSGELVLEGMRDPEGWSGHWVEVSNEARELAGAAGHLTELSLDPNAGTVVLRPPLPADLDAERLRIRRWDHDLQAGDPEGIPLGSDWQGLENGIEVRFGDDQDFRTGDHWLVPARAATGDIEWPPYENDDPSDPLFPSLGEPRRYYPLAWIRREATGSLRVEQDLRPIFPQLNRIEARDVCYDDDGSLDADNVQDAIDALKDRAGGGRCTIVVAPGPGWERALRRLKAGTNAEICFPVGSFPLERILSLRRMGHLLLSGAGPGTRIVSRSHEGALRFEECGSVTLRDLSVRSEVSREPRLRTPASAVGLRGAVDCIDCGAVTLERVRAACQSAGDRSACGIRVARRGRAAHLPDLGTATIRDCIVTAGHQQVGMELIDLRRAHVENNVVRPPPTLDREAVWRFTIRNRDARRAMARHFVGPSQSRSGAPPDMRNGVDVNLPGRGRVRVRVPAPLERSVVLTASRFRGAFGSDSERFRALGRSVFEDVANGRETVHRMALDWLRRGTRAHVAQGIVVAGNEVGDVRLVGNDLRGVRQGIHIGTSRFGAPTRAVRRALVTQNKVVVQRGADRLQQHAIYVGRCQMLTVRGNELQVVDPYAKGARDGVQTTALGVHVAGDRGLLMAIEENVVTDFDIGIYIPTRPGESTEPPRASRWYVRDNVGDWTVPTLLRTVEVPASVEEKDNVPMPL